MSNLNKEVTIRCKYCNGSGNIKSESDYQAPCAFCGGSGRVPMIETGPATFVDTILHTDDYDDKSILDMLFQRHGLITVIAFLLNKGFKGLRARRVSD